MATTVSVGASGGGQGSVRLIGESTGQFGRTVQVVATAEGNSQFVRWNITKIEPDPAPEAPFAPPPVEAPAPVFSPIESPIFIPAPIEAPAPVMSPETPPPVEAPAPVFFTPPPDAPPPPVEAPIEVPAPVFVLAPFTINIGQCGGSNFGMCPDGYTCQGTFSDNRGQGFSVGTSFSFDCVPTAAPEAPVAAPEAPVAAPEGSSGGGGGASGNFTYGGTDGNTRSSVEQQNQI